MNKKNIENLKFVARGALVVGVLTIASFYPSAKHEFENVHLKLVEGMEEDVTFLLENEQIDKKRHEEVKGNIQRVIFDLRDSGLYDKEFDNQLIFYDSEIEVIDFTKVDSKKKEKFLAKYKEFTPTYELNDITSVNKKPLTEFLDDVVALKP